jgi:hypothetical protein
MKTFLVGNNNNEKKQEILVNVDKKTVRTSNKKIRRLIKDYLNGKFINQGHFMCSIDLNNNYVILNDNRHIQ